MKRFVLAGMLFLATGVASRAEFYLGGSITSTSSEFETALDNFDSSETGWKAYAGYNFLRFLGAEVGYRDLGSFTDSSDLGSIDLDLKVIDGSARVYLPIVPILHVFARVGYANIAWDGRIDVGDTFEDFDEDNWELYYGVGAELNIGKQFAIRAEWEKYDVSDDLNTFSAGIVFRF